MACAQIRFSMMRGDWRAEQDEQSVKRWRADGEGEEDG